MRVPILLLLPGLLYLHFAYGAGDRTDVRGVGMAGATVATSWGLDAVGINPAGLAAPESGTITFSLLPLGVRVGSDFLTYDLYSSYFTGVATDSGRVGRYLTEQDKQHILDAFNGPNGRVSADVQARLFGAALRLGDLGAIGLTVTERAVGFMRVPRDYVAFLLRGNQPGTTLDFSDSDVKGTWTREYALSYGRDLPRPPFLASLSAGAAVKIVHGFGYFELQRFNTTLNTSSNGTLTGTMDLRSIAAGINVFTGDSAGKYLPFGAPAGTGIAVDLGVSGALNEFLSFGLAVTDIGSMSWTQNIEQTSVDTTLVVDDPFGADQKDLIKHTLKGTRTHLSTFSSPMPTQLRVGCAIQVNRMPVFDHFPGDLLLALDYTQGFSETPGSTTTPRVSLGAEYLPLHWLPLRTGIALGGIDHFSFAFGFGVDLGVFQLDVASDNVQWLFAPKSLTTGSLAMGMLFRI